MHITFYSISSILFSRISDDVMVSGEIYCNYKLALQKKSLGLSCTKCKIISVFV